MSSDDEDYYDEFDDEEIIWIEDAEPGIADDLAATTTYDPTFQDDPSLETVELFSDWDELSDDYYDEDPTAIRRLRAMGAWPVTEESTHIESTDIRSIQRRQKLKPDLASFQGVVWRHPADEADIVDVHAPGEGEKVALLKNWREVFRNAKPAIGRLRVRKANPRVLDRVAVGLGQQSVPGLDSAPSSGLSSPSVGDLRGTDAPQGLGKPLYSSSIHARVVVTPPSDLPVHPKKVKVGYFPEDKVKHSLESSEGNGGAKTDAAPAEPSVEEPAKVSAITPRRGRKRKASVSLDEQSKQLPNTSGTAAQHRSKRVAPSKTAQSTDRPAAASGPVRRSARHKK